MVGKAYDQEVDQVAQERIFFGIGHTPPRTSDLYLKKVNENNQTQKNVYFRIRYVQTNKYIQVADLDSSGNPSHGYTGMDDTIVWFEKSEITEKKKTILYTEIQEDATIFVSNPWDNSGAIYIPGIKAGQYEAEEIRNDNLGYQFSEDKPPWKTMETFPITAGNGYTEVVIRNDSPYTNIRIIKTGEGGKLLPNVHFKIKRLAGGDLNYDSYIQVKDLTTGTGIVNGETITGVGHEELRDGKKEILYTPNREDATEFVTNSKGEIYIGMVLEGDYEAIEVSNDDPTYRVDKTPHPFVARWGMEHEEVVEIKNYVGAPPGIIELLKVDREDHSKKLANVHFTFMRTDSDDPKGYVQVKDANEKVIKGPITGVGAGSGYTFEYVDNESEATDFVTDKDGKILIYGILSGSYEAHETKNENADYEENNDTISFYVKQGLTTSTQVLVENDKESETPTPDDDKTVFTKLIEGTSVPLEGFQFEWRERTISQEYADDYPEFFDAQSDVYKEPDGDGTLLGNISDDSITLKEEDKIEPVYGYKTVLDHYEHHVEPYLDEYGQQCYDENGQLITVEWDEPIYVDIWTVVGWVCTTHGNEYDEETIDQGYEHCRQYNEKREEVKSQIWEKMDKFREARKKGIDEVNSHPYTDKYGQIDITPLFPEDDDKLGEIEQREVSVGWNPYFNIEDHKDWELITYWEDVTWYDKRRRMDIEGYIWEDEPNAGKDGKDRQDSDGRRGGNESLIYPISVELKCNGGRLGQGVITNDGKYRIRVGGRDGSDLDTMLKNLNNCYLEFTYNGLKYQSVYPAWSSKESIALENSSVRRAFNEKFSTIVSNGGDIKSNNVSSGNTEIIFKEDGQYKRKIDYEGNVPELGKSGEAADPIGDGKYTGVQRMRPSSQVDDLTPTEQNAPHKYDKNNEYANNCYTYTNKSQNTKYQITATTSETGWDGIKKYTVAQDRISGANFGIYRREQPDVSLVNDIERVDITMNGEEYIYQYGAKTNQSRENSVDNMLATPGVKFKSNVSNTYTREIYGEQVKIKTSAQNDVGDKFKIKVYYKTTVKNESTHLTLQNIEIASDYDKVFDEDYVRSEIEDEFAGSPSVTWQKPLEKSKYTKGTGENRKEKDRHIAFGTLNATIEPNDKVTFYTSYTIIVEDRQEFTDLANKKRDDVTVNNNVEINAYKTTYANQERSGEIGPAYAGVDEDSAAGNSKVGFENTYEDDNDEAPSLEISLVEPRTISGNVFEDLAKEDSAGDKRAAGELMKYLGNGKYDKEEKGVRNVKVELVEVDSDGIEMTNPDGSTKVLTCDYRNTEETPHSAVYYTTDGKYSFTGFIPGKYIVKFTWGQDVDGDGKRSTTFTSSEKTAYVQQYKSTTFSNEIRYNNMVSINRWYLYNIHQDKSNAIDDMTERNNIDNQTGKIGQDHVNHSLVYPDIADKNLEWVDEDEKSLITSIPARTPVFDVGIENKEENSENTNQKGTGTDSIPLSIERLDFGISERPKMRMTLEKRIERVKLSLANGTVVADSTVNWNKDGTSANLKGSTQNVTYPKPQRTSDRENTGIFKVELDKEILQSAILEVTYKYTIKNESDLDYNVTKEDYNDYNSSSNRFYKFATKQTENDEVTIAPSKIIDYLDNKMGFIEDSNNELWKESPREDNIKNGSEIIADGPIARLLYDGRFDSSGSASTEAKEAYTEQTYNNYTTIGGTSNIQSQLKYIYNAYRTILRDTTDNIPNEEKLTPRNQTEIRYTASKQLSDTDTDLNFYNVVELAELSKSGGAIPEEIMAGNNDPTTTGSHATLGDSDNYIGEYDYSVVVEHDGDYASVVTIVPPTGNDTNFTTIAWTILGVSSLGILASGIVLIKKIVLKGRKI